MRPPRMVLAVVLVVLVALPGTAPAQSKTAGSSLSAAANYPYHCDWRWAAGYGGQQGAFGPGGQQEYTPFYVGPSTCSIGHLGLNGQQGTSHLVPGTGTVTMARVKSGPNPAPVSIATVRSFQGRDQQGQYRDTCCQGISETPTVTPVPNGITEIPVNFRVEAQAFDPNTNRAGFHDIVVVNVHGNTGTLPIHDNGEPKPFAAGASSPNDHQTFWYFPQIDPSQTNQNRWDAPGFEVLMNYDWCPAARVRQAGGGCAVQGPAPGGGGSPEPQPQPQPQPGGGGPADTGQPQSPGLATVGSSRLTLRGSTVAVKVTCNATRACTGRLRLKARGRTLGSKSIRIAPSKTSTVKLRLSKRNRRRVPSGGVRASVQVDLGTAGVITRSVTLRRG